MRSQVVNVGSSTTSSSSPSTGPVSDSKRSVFERLGRQIDSNTSSLTPVSKVSNNSSQSSSSIVREPLPGPSTQTSSIKKRLTDPLWEASSERRRQSSGIRSRYIDPVDIGCQSDNSNNNTKNSMDPPMLPEIKSSSTAAISSIGNRPQSPSSQMNVPPKYDRHGNLIISLREKRRLMNHNRWPPSSRRPANGDFFPHHHPLNRDMELRQPGHPLYSHFVKGGSMNRDHSFLNMTQYGGSGGGGGGGNPRNNPSMHNISNQHGGEEASRYVTWRERRNAITSLDREAARSNSKTNSLKSTLQSSHKDNGANSSNLKLSPLLNTNSSSPTTGNGSATKLENTTPSSLGQSTSKPCTSNNGQGSTADETATTIKRKKDSSNASKEPPTDMSDGEIVDDDSSDEDIMQTIEVKEIANIAQQHQQPQQQYYSRGYNVPSRYSEHSNSALTNNSGRTKERNTHDEVGNEDGLNMGAKIRSNSSPRLQSISVWEVNRMSESRSSARGEKDPEYHGDSREVKNKDSDSLLNEPPAKKKHVDIAADQIDNPSNDNLETISDDEFDAIVDEDQESSTKGSSSSYPDDNKTNRDNLEEKQSSQTTNGLVQQKSICADKGESELIKALGIDWANLCDLAKKQSKSREIFTPGCARLRFTAPHYLKILRISPELAGEELMNQINKICGRIELNEKSASDSLNQSQVKEDQTSSHFSSSLVGANEIFSTNLDSLDQYKNQNASISSPNSILDRQAITTLVETESIDT